MVLEQPWRGVGVAAAEVISAGGALGEQVHISIDLFETRLASPHNSIEWLAHLDMLACLEVTGPLALGKDHCCSRHATAQVLQLRQHANNWFQCPDDCFFASYRSGMIHQLSIEEYREKRNRRREPD